MTHEERTLLIDLYRAALSSESEQWDTFALCWKAAETDRPLEDALHRINREWLAIDNARN